MKKLFVDMDGVLADFDKRWEQLFGCKPKDGFNKTFWKRFCESEQFETLDGFPGYKDLVKYLEEVDQLPGVSVSILGSTGGYDYHGITQDQKLKWLRTQGILFPAIFVPGKRFKRYHATSSSMLIDDHPENCSEFILHGGHSHQYIEPIAAIKAIETFIHS